jgi:hypothetical protein
MTDTIDLFTIPGTITRIDPSELEGFETVSREASCCICRADFEGDQIYYDIDYTPREDGPPYYVPENSSSTCSMRHARIQAAKQPDPVKRLVTDHGQPIGGKKRKEEDFWIRAYREVGHYPWGTDGYSGKWLVFPSVERVNDVWTTIKTALQNGKLGATAKVATEPNRDQMRGIMTVVICVYTYDYRDKEDVFRIREELRKLGVTQKIYYKADSETWKEHYSAPGRRVSMYAS